MYLLFAYLLHREYLFEGERTMEKNECLALFDYVSDWQNWRETLHKAIGEARSLGWSDKEIKDTAKRVGDFLAERVCPATPEEKLLQELWNAGSPEERKILATLLFKIME